MRNPNVTASSQARRRIAAVSTYSIGSCSNSDQMAAASALVAEARALRYQPLVAESLALLGTISYKSEDARGAEARA